MSVRSTRRPVAVLIATALPLAAALPAACVSGPANRELVTDPTANIPVTTRIEGNSTAAEVRSVSNSPGISEAALTAPRAKAFAALPGVFEALGVPFNVVVSDAGTLGARDMRMPRRLGKVPLSHYIDCGINATGTANADLYAVTMTVLSRVTPTGEGTSTVATQVVANARPITVSGNAVRCSSTGRLEQAINTRLTLDAAR